jgi:hypothetical protein
MLLTRYGLADRLAIICAICDKAGLSPSPCSMRRPGNFSADQNVVLSDVR